MAVLVYNDIETLYLDDLQANVTVDKPVTTGAASEASRDINDAYATIWEIEGGSVKRVNSATAWVTSPTSGTTGKSLGLLTDVKEILHIWSSATVGSTGGEAGENELRRVDIAEINFRRSLGAATGSYARPVIYAVERQDTTTPADVNKLFLDVWPGISGIYLPIWYVPQFTEIAPTGVTTPNVTDLGSRDIAHLAAINRAPRIGRAEFIPDLFAKLQERTQLFLVRKRSAMTEGLQDEA